MYSQAIIERNQQALEKRLGLRLRRYTPEQSWAVAEHLGPEPREVTADEAAFIRNEVHLISLDFRYFAERYAIMDLDGGGAGHIKLKESQELVLSRYLAPAEERVAAEVAAGEPTDGLRFYWHKARQLYATTTAIMLIWHRLLSIRDSKALGGVAEDDKLAAYYSRHERLWSSLPWWLRPPLKYESKGEHLVLDGLDSSIWFAAGNQKGGMGQGNQYELQHLTECAFWLDPVTHIDYVLKDTLPQSPRTLAIRESTANGRGDWWHTNTEDARKGLSGWGYIFIPWYAVTEKRRRKPPTSEWRPDETTLRHADMVLRTSPEWLGRQVTLDLEQLYWWESERKNAQRTHGLALFYSNNPATPDESFQHFQNAAFETEQVERWRTGTSVPQMAMEVLIRG